MNGFVKKWLEKLRSGEYAQSRGQLKRVRQNGDCSFCALGVLCDIYPEGAWSNRAGGIGYYEVGEQTNGHGLIPEIEIFTGLDNDLFENVITWNDRDKLSFEEIADRVEETLA